MYFYYFTFSIPAGGFLFFSEKETSAENLAIVLFDRISSQGLEIIKIELKETTSSTVIYEGA